MSEHRIFHVTVEQRHVLTYAVTTADGVADEKAAEDFIKQADIETLDNHEVHEETLQAEVVTAEDVTPTTAGAS